MTLIGDFVICKVILIAIQQYFAVFGDEDNGWVGDGECFGDCMFKGNDLCFGSDLYECGVLDSPLVVVFGEYFHKI